MKKVILTLLVLIVTVIGVNAQSAHISGAFGATDGVEPHNKNLTSYPLTFNIGVGVLFDNGVYTGIGLSPGMHEECYHSDDRWYDEYRWSETKTSFIMPFYWQLSYVKPESWYGDIKVGGEQVCVDGQSGTFFFVSVIPVGYTFDWHNSVGLGWRYHTKKEFQGHAITLTYNYTF